ncbi:hypothetical protein A2291_01570 [candidate division WOR-1 bacterium RIFOXYB2_FULL_42_35]|uniref:Transposase IS200-like domain-containing protein n=1 Tax=candidate division WOR-1 bacterium RIFOXYC2_FULL_41_25 TaxID=1802586 RepID=A0A1F4TQ47_UNCSA|nr:MAG: hypothetical protein A2247_03370 [candidate division WOR-1 bacterium RIFOXYA2_FULL_41_14]OGC25435.1 MAG: hypothetical protein A2291_01570 [candidate division WOR-1 bacterium RIFOXYB2_FULL_42_35]OGC34841.1 MAG: hypothetical protein A2462_05505 [candidate division WOR-1 bacterium RIFOXYC2_FULL_41_25]
MKHEKLPNRDSYDSRHKNALCLDHEIPKSNSAGRGYFVVSSGNVTDEVIMQYIESQGREPVSEDFSVEDAVVEGMGDFSRGEKSTYRL